MLYSVANLHEIGFIARVHARISRWILVFVTLYVWRVAFLFVRAISARTEILNRGTRKCQSRQRHVRLQRVPPLVPPTSRRDATRRDGNGKVRQKLNGKKKRANCFETVLLLIGMPPPCRAEIEPCKKWSILFYVARCACMSAVFQFTWRTGRSIRMNRSNWTWLDYSCPQLAYLINFYAEYVWM